MLRRPVPVRPTPAEEVSLRFAYADIRPDPADVCCALGYPAGEQPEVALDALRGIDDHGELLWEVEAGWATYGDLEVDRAGGRVRLGGEPFEAGELVCAQLARATSVAVFLCTVGPGISDLMGRLMSGGDPFTSFVASWLGSLAVERAADRLQEELGRRAAANGLRLTNRYSPGYCGWPVSDQQRLFRLLPPGFCGVRLSKTSLMQPIKSVSGFIGVGQSAVFDDYTCARCELESCIARTVRAARQARARTGPGGA